MPTLHLRAWKYPDRPYYDLADLVRKGLRSSEPLPTPLCTDMKGRGVVWRCYGPRAPRDAASRWHSFAYDQTAFIQARRMKGEETCAEVLVVDCGSKRFMAGYMLRCDEVTAGKDRVLRLNKELRWSRSDRSYHIDKATLRKIADPQWRVVKLLPDRELSNPDTVYPRIVADQAMVVFGSLRIPYTATFVVEEGSLTAFGKIDTYHHKSFSRGNSYTGGALAVLDTRAGITCSCLNWPSRVSAMSLLCLGHARVGGELATHGRSELATHGRSGGVCVGGHLHVGDNLACSGIRVGDALEVGNFRNQSEVEASGGIIDCTGKLATGAGVQAKRIRCTQAIECGADLVAYGDALTDGIEARRKIVANRIVSYTWVRSDAEIEAKAEIVAKCNVIAGYEIKAPRLKADKVFAGVHPVSAEALHRRCFGEEEPVARAVYDVDVDNIDAVVMCGTAKPALPNVESRTVILGGADAREETP